MTLAKLLLFVASGSARFSRAMSLRSDNVHGATTPAAPQTGQGLAANSARVQTVHIHNLAGGEIAVVEIAPNMTGEEIKGLITDATGEKRFQLLSATGNPILNEDGSVNLPASAGHVTLIALLPELTFFDLIRTQPTDKFTLKEINNDTGFIDELKRTGQQVSSTYYVEKTDDAQGFFPDQNWRFFSNRDAMGHPRQFFMLKKHPSGDPVWPLFVEDGRVGIAYRPCKVPVVHSPLNPLSYLPDASTDDRRQLWEQRVGEEEKLWDIMYDALERGFPILNPIYMEAQTKTHQ